MKIDVTTLRRVSPLLDEALDLEGPRRDEWFVRVEHENPDLAPILRDLLKKQASVETNDFLERGPEFTSPRSNAQSTDFKSGDSVGCYRLIRELGTGGMGEVWLAERSDGVLKRSVALKLPMLSLKRSVLVQRFERERDILASLTHPNIARLYDAGLTDNGQPYLALEYVEGEPITQYASRTQLDTRAQVALLLQVMQAVQYAHANLVIHRDLKPANVLVTAAGQALLLDFGIAKLLEGDAPHAEETELTRVGGRALTLGYAAPEQVTGAPISTATDVYAVGVVLYEMLTRHRPFSGTRREVEQAILTAEPARPQGLPADLVTVLLKALKKSPSERYATMDSFAADLENWLQGMPVTAQPDSTAYRMRKFVGRNRWGVTSAAVVSCALVAATAVSLWQASIARRESQTAAAVEKFLTGIFQANSSEQPDPEKARKTTARELLDIGAKRIVTELQAAPQAKLRILEMLGNLYNELTLTEPALALFQQQVELLRQTEPADSVKLAKALALVGDRAEQAGKKEQSQKAYGEAIAILDRRGDTSTKERGFVEARYAGALFDWRDPKAFETVKRAASILKQFPSSEELLWALQVQAMLTTETPAKLKLMREAVEIASAMPDLNPQNLITLQVSLGQALTSDNQIMAGETSLRTAYDMALAKEGPDSRVTLNAARVLGTLLDQNGEYVKALAAAQTAVVSARQLIAKGDRSWLNLILIANLGATMMKMGELEKGLEILATSQKERDILDVNPPIDIALHRFVALAHTYRGNHLAATAELDAAQTVIFKNKMDVNGREAKLIQISRRECAVIRGDGRLSQEFVLQGTLADVPIGETPNAALRRWVSLAEAQFVAGDLPAALTTATQTINTLPQSTAPAFDGDWERRASLVAGKVHILQGQAELAVPLLERAVGLAEGRLDTRTSPDHADALIWLGQAQFAKGRVQAASQLARQAQEIHSRHPQLDEAFRKPLIALNARLKT